MPFGLKRYRGRMFDKLHGPGSMVVTGSGVPEMFGLGRHGRYAYALHLVGLQPLPPVDNAMTRRGKRLQDVVALELAEKTERKVKRVEAFAQRSDIPLAASPDALIWIDDILGDAELKVVARPVFDAEWEGRPPMKVLLQKQAQFGTLGTKIGTVAAMVISTYEFELYHWDVEAHPGTIERIETETDELIRSLARGDLPDPDLAKAQDRTAFLKLNKYAERGKVIRINGADALALADRYQAARALAKEANDKADEAKANLMALLGDAEIGELEDGRGVRAALTERAGYEVAPSTYRNFCITKPNKAKKDS